MLFLLLTLLVSPAAAPAANGASCLRAPGRHESAPSVLVMDCSARREDQAASRRIHTAAVLPSARFVFSPPLTACACYAPPALGPREAAATPSSQRDPPDSLA